MRITHALLKRLPKVELHCHLDGSLRVETVFDLAQKDKVDLHLRDDLLSRISSEILSIS